MSFNLEKVKLVILIILTIIPTIAYASEFMGGSAWIWLLFFSIIFLIIALPSIIIGVLMRYKQIFYTLILWVLLFISLQILYFHYSPLYQYKGPLKPFLIFNKWFGKYILLFAIGLLLGAYLGRNNNKWKLDKKFSQFSSAIFAAILLWIIYFLFYLMGGKSF